jgi:hypothetical protein
MRHLKKRYRSIVNDLEKFEKELHNNPDAGIDLGGNIRKIRISIESKGKGKSGGGRIITYNIIAGISNRKIILLTIYDKSERQNIGKAEIKAIIKKCGAL